MNPQHSSQTRIELPVQAGFNKVFVVVNRTRKQALATEVILLSEAEIHNQRNNDSLYFVNLIGHMVRIVRKLYIDSNQLQTTKRKRYIVLF